MRRNHRIAGVVGGCVAVAAGAAWLLGWFSGGSERVPPAATPDLSDHPIYSQHDFGRDDRVIDVGVQPLWIPTNLISEAMRRDGILRKDLADRGLEIRFHGFLKGADVNFFLARGDLEVGIGGDMPALTAVVNSEVTVASVVQRGSCWIVAREHMLIQDLAGMRIGYPFGSISHYTLLRTLASAGLGESDVDLVPMDVGPMPDALDRGEIDAFAAWEPTPTIALTQCKKAVLIHGSLSAGYMYFSRSLARERPAAMRRIVAAQIRAMKWMRRDRDNLLRAARWAMRGGERLTGKSSPLSEQVYANLAMKDLLGITSTPEIPAEALSGSGPLFRELEFLKKIGEIGAGAQWENIRACFEPAIVGGIVARGNEYRLGTFGYVEEREATDEGE